MSASAGKEEESYSKPICPVCDSNNKATGVAREKETALTTWMSTTPGLDPVLHVTSCCCLPLRCWKSSPVDHK
ncbi:hypothetical protein BgiMline_030446 [Biomphalaria glabrata]